MSEDWRIKKNYRTKRNCVRRHVLLVSLLVSSEATFEIGCLTQTFPESAKVLFKKEWYWLCLFKVMVIFFGDYFSTIVKLGVWS